MRKEPNMHCLTPSNPTKIAEGKSYSINETIDELKQLSNATTTDNLLGPEKETIAMKLSAEEIHTELRNLQQLLPESRMCDLDFLKAQMLHEYKPQKIDSKRGGRSTEVKYSRKSKNVSDSANLEEQV
jgi:DNA polymerase gamma 1